MLNVLLEQNSIRNTAEGSPPPHIPPVTAGDVAVYYFEVHDSATVARQMELSEEGRLLDPWPDGFFEEGFHERFTEEQS
jgi:hypothetical protein